MPATTIRCRVFGLFLYFFYNFPISVVIDGIITTIYSIVEFYRLCRWQLLKGLTGKWVWVLNRSAHHRNKTKPSTGAILKSDIIRSMRLPVPKCSRFSFSTSMAFVPSRASNTFADSHMYQQVFQDLKIEAVWHPGRWTIKHKALQNLPKLGKISTHRHYLGPHRLVA